MLDPLPLSDTIIDDLGFFWMQVEVLRREAGTMYLGRLLSLWDARDTEINHRMRRAWAKFGAFKKELTDKGYSLFQRLRLFNSLVTPSILYGCASWVMTASREQTIRTTQRKMLRAILGKGRRPIENCSSDTSTDAAVEELEVTEQIESWVEWIQSAMREATETMRKVGEND